MDYYLNDSTTAIYDTVLEDMDNWQENLYEESDKLFETQLEEYVFETYNNKCYLDHNDYPDTDEFAFDLLDIAREISKYYERDYGVPFNIHEYTNKKIVNLYALLCAEKIQQDMIEDYENEKKPRQQ